MYQRHVLEGAFTEQIRCPFQSEICFGYYHGVVLG